MERLRRTILPAIGLLFLLTACGTATESGASDGGDDLDPAGSTCLEGTEDCNDADLGGDDAGSGDASGAAGGTCLEGTEDCVDADLSGEGEEVVTGDFDVEMARRDAESLLGATEEDLEAWGDVRVERKGDEEFMLTMDLQPGRKTVQLDEDADGVYRVTTVTLELEDGSTEVFTN